jgi:acyl dehydratase
MPKSTLGPLTRTDFVRYQGASGDFNPIHHDEEFARAAGAESVFGVGMLHAGVLGTRLARWVGPENVLAYGVRFTGQVWPGDTLSFTGAVRDIEETEKGPVAVIDLEVRSQKDETVMTATARAKVAAT